MFIPVSHTKHIARQASISTSEVYQKKVKNKPETNSGAEKIFRKHPIPFFSQFLPDVVTDIETFFSPCISHTLPR